MTTRCTYCLSTRFLTNAKKNMTAKELQAKLNDVNYKKNMVREPTVLTVG